MCSFVPSSFVVFSFHHVFILSALNITIDLTAVIALLLPCVALNLVYRWQCVLDKRGIVVQV